MTCLQPSGCGELVNAMLEWDSFRWKREHWESVPGSMKEPSETLMGRPMDDGSGERAAKVNHQHLSQTVHRMQGLCNLRTV